MSGAPIFGGRLSADQSGAAQPTSTTFADPGAPSFQNAPAAAPAGSGKPMFTGRLVDDQPEAHAASSSPATATPAQSSGPDWVGIIMRSNPITAGIDAGLNAMGTNSTQALQQTLSGINAGIGPDLLEAPRTIMSLGPRLSNAIFGTKYADADWVPDFGGEAVRKGMTDVGAIKAPTDNFVDKLLRSSGEAAGGALLPETALETAATRGSADLATILKGLAPAASSGAAQEATAEVAPDNQGAQIAAGLIGGVVPTTALSGVRAITAPKALLEDGSAVPSKLVAAVKRDGIPLDQVQQQVADLGPAGTVADLGDNTQKLAAAIATRPGAPGATIANAMKARAADSTNRVPAAVNDILGPTRSPNKIKADIATNMQSVGPQYDKVLATAAPVDPTALAADIDQQIATKKGPARAALQEVRAMLNVNGADATDPMARLDTSAQGLFETRNAIDGMISPTGNPKVNGALKQVRNQVDTLLQQAAPGIKDVDAQYAELARQRDAVDTGYGETLRRGENPVWPVDNAAQISDLAQPAGGSIGPSAGPLRLTQGARADIERIVGTNINDRRALATVLGSESDWNVQKLAQLFGQDRADRIMRVVDAEKRMAETENLAVNGSKTAAITAAQQDLEPPAWPGAVTRASGWSVPNAAAAAAAPLVDKFMSGAAARRDQGIADAIMGRGVWAPAPKKPFFTPQQRNAQYAAMLSAIMRPAAASSAAVGNP